MALRFVSYGRLFTLVKMMSQKRTQWLMKHFYQSAVMGVWRYCLIYWGGNIQKINIERLNDVVKKAERVVVVGLAPVKSIYQKLLGRKLHRVCEDEEHPLNDVLLVAVVSVVGWGYRCWTQVATEGLLFLGPLDYTLPNTSPFKILK